MNKDIILENSLHFIEITYEPDSYHIDFKVWSIGLSYPENNVKFHDEAAICGWDGDSDRTKCLPYIEGSLKWDGCINYTFPGQDRCMLHNCGLDDFQRIFDIFEEIYAQGKELMPSCNY